MIPDNLVTHCACAWEMSILIMVIQTHGSSYTYMFVARRAGKCDKWERKIERREKVTQDDFISEPKTLKRFCGFIFQVQATTLQVIVNNLNTNWKKMINTGNGGLQFFKDVLFLCLQVLSCLDRQRKRGRKQEPKRVPKMIF